MFVYTFPLSNSNYVHTIMKDFQRHLLLDFILLLGGFVQTNMYFQKGINVVYVLLTYPPYSHYV